MDELSFDPHLLFKENVGKLKEIRSPMSDHPHHDDNGFRYPFATAAVNHQDTKFIRESQEKNDEFFRQAKESWKTHQNEAFRLIPINGIRLF
jgi:hypothetical protein